MPDCALSVIFNEAERDAFAKGLNTRLVVQLPPADNEVPQFELCAKSDAFAPMIAMLMGVSAVPLSGYF